MITIKSEKKSYGINFPTSIDEITAEHLATITNGVKLPPHYCIVALAFNTKVFEFCASINSNRNSNIKVIPVLAKISAEDSCILNANVGDKVIINRSSLERGSHINIKTAINSSYASKYFSDDPELLKAILSKSKIGNIDESLVASKSQNIIVLEFKIVPVNEIVATIPMNYIDTDPFINKGEVTDKASVEKGA